MGDLYILGRVDKRVLGDRFELVGQLGDSKTMWYAHDFDTGKKVLLRILNVSKRDLHGWVRLEALLESISKIDDESLVDIIEWGDCDSGKYIAFELIDGTPLNQKKLSLENSIKVLIQIAKTLEVLHKHDVIHPNLRSKSVIILDKEIKVTGFDTLLSERTRLKTLKSNEIVDALLWLAPELLEGGHKDVESNLYNLGIIAYEMICGELPFKDTNPNSLVWSIRSSVPSPISTYNPKVPVTFENLVKRLLKKDPTSRPKDAAEVIKLLEKSLLELNDSSSISSREGLVLHRGRLVGKLKELSAVADILKNPSGELIVVEGTTGIGKTRFLQEISGIARTNDIRVLFTSCKLDRQSTPWAVVGDIVEEIVAMEGISIIGRSTYKREFSSISSGLQKRTMIESSKIYKDSILLQNRLLEAFTWLLQETIKKEPLVLIIDDLLHCDIESFEIISSCIRNAKIKDLVVIVSITKNDKSKALVESLDTQKGVIRIDLSPLTLKQTNELLHEIVGNEKIPIQLVDQLYKKTGGNPLELLQTMVGLITNKSLQNASESDKITTEPLPGNLDAISDLRIKGLDSVTREVLIEAAVLGDSFFENMLVDVSSHPRSTVEESLDQSAMSMLLTLTKTADGFKYSFMYPQLRTRLQSLMSENQSKSFNDRVARYIKSKLDNSLDKHLDKLILHLSNGSDITLAVPYLVRASVYAKNNFQTKKALAYAKQAHSVAIKSGNSRLMVDASIQLSNIYTLMGNTNEALQVQGGIQKAVKHIGIDIVNEAKLIIQTAVIHAYYGNFKESEVLIQEAHKRIGKHSDESMIAALHILESKNTRPTDKLMSLSHAQTAIKLSQNELNQSVYYKALENLAEIELDIGEYQKAYVTCKSAAKIASELGSLDSRIRINLVEARRLILTGQLSEAETLLESAIANSSRMNSKYLQTEAFHLMTLLEYTKGDFKETLELSKKTLQLAQEISHKIIKSKQYILLGLVNHEYGDIAGVQRMLDESISIDSSIDINYASPSRDLLASLHHFEIGDFDRAANIVFSIISDEKRYSHEEKFEAYRQKTMIELRKGEHKKALTTTKHIENSYKEILSNPVKQCEFQIMLGDIFISQIEGFNHGDNKTRMFGAFMKQSMPLSDNQQKTIETILDNANILALSNALRHHTIKTIHLQIRYNLALAESDAIDDKSSLITKSSELLSVAKMLSEETSNKNLISKTNKLSTRLEAISNPR
ncbi:MAG TPA: protein kinase [Caldisericia bacterium]|nr:protein kinase [Caldisericia bacterium]